MHNFFLLARIEKHCCRCGRIAMLPCDIACRWTQANNEKAKEVLAFKSSPRQQMHVEHKRPEGREKLV